MISNHLARMNRIAYVLSILSFYALTACNPVSDDYLVYMVADSRGHTHLMLYDPEADTHTALLPEWQVDNISMSAQNRLAFSSSYESPTNIYVLDYPFVGKTPTNITLNTGAENHLSGWSQGGRYLAYEAAQLDEKALFLWNGQVSISIYQYKTQIGELAWSADDRLAFTEFYAFTHSANQEVQDYSDVFVWDGTAVRSVSQNPSGVDHSPNWSADGKLAFISERNDEYDVFIWDGRSTLDGLPDVRTFINVAPDLTGYVSDPVWTDAGTLSFVGFGAVDSDAQIYEWDGQKAINISQNPGLHNFGQRWRGDGYWAFVTFFSSEQLLYVRDANNQTLLSTSGQYPPAWSENGLLMFCVPSYPAGEWGLAIWDGSIVVEIANGNEIKAIWRNGSSVVCSNG